MLADPPARRGLVTPFARALTLLEAWTPADVGLGNLELAHRTGLPASTVTRLAQTLVQLGYLHHAPTDRRYRLAAPVMALGYGAIADSAALARARGPMRDYAEQHQVHVNLSGRDRLDLIVLENCPSRDAPAAMALNVGARIGIASSPLGWALLASLPDLERYYLLEKMQRRMPRDWGRIGRQANQGIAQVHESGWCTSGHEPDHEVAVIAMPLRVPGSMPLVLSCIGARARLTRARMARELAPRLLAMVTTIEVACLPEAA